MIVDRDEFVQFARYIQCITGIFLDDSKKYLVESRFDCLCNELGCSRINELHMRALQDGKGVIAGRIIDLITTHESFFFRDEQPFEILKELVTKLYISRTGGGGASHLPVIDIWSAGCSTGQEIYSIAIALREILYNAAFTAVRILGTDISDECITKASYGKYTQLEVERGLSPERLERNFKREGTDWKVRDEIRAMVTFKRMNLLEDFSFLRNFDAILCRNVAIYFTLEDRKRLFERMAVHLNKDSVMILGLTETIYGVTNQLCRMENRLGVYYQRA